MPPSPSVPTETSPTTPTPTSPIPLTAIQDFVLRHKGHTPISKILIANNGMAAVKAIRSIHKWAYETFGDERAIQFTAMCTPEDLKVNAEFVRMADQYVQVPGGTSNHNYANVDLIVDIAERVGVHAVWVGWGFASENPVLAEKLATLNPPVVFIGPPPSAMRALGDKIASTIVAQSANVPCVSWSGEGITVDTKDENGHTYVPPDIYHKATTHSASEGLAHAQRIGFPVMIKASEGGGGKGIRLVDDPNQFEASFNQVQREVPGSPIFIMRVVRNARHLEVQLLADSYGNAIALFGRDCSVQRRHQKIIEEAPITIASAETLENMENAAVRLAKLVGYVSAGTVEYLYEPATKEYYFLELNPRLQVEHPTTEMVSGVNIPAAQLQIAMGLPLSSIRDIRTLYALPPSSSTPIDFSFSTPESRTIQRKPSPKGHVIAARITAENPDAGFKPNSGKVLELNFRSGSNVWGYFSVNGVGGGVHEFADSQFGHVFSYGGTRNEARRNLVMALKELSIRGDFRTTVEYLIKLLETETYIENAVTTGWLDSLISQSSQQQNRTIETAKPDSILTAICGATVMAHTTHSENLSEFEKAVDKGQTPPKSLLSTSETVEFIYQNTQYKIHTAVTGPESFRLQINDSSVDVIAKKLADEGLLILLGGNKHLVYAKHTPGGMRLEVDNKTCILEKDSDPTLLRSPSPGKLVRFLVDDGQRVEKGMAWAELEVMKMYMPLIASENGVIKLGVIPPGSVVQAGDIIARLELDDPQKVQKAVLYEGEFPNVGGPVVVGEKVHQRYEYIIERVEGVFGGYVYSEDPTALVKALVGVLRDDELPFGEFSQSLSSLAGRIPIKLDTALHEELDKLREHKQPFSASLLQTLINKTRGGLPKAEVEGFNTLIAPLQTVLDRYALGLKYHERSVLSALLGRYTEMQMLFSETGGYEGLLTQLRQQYPSVGDITSISLSYTHQATQHALIEAVLDVVREDTDGDPDGDAKRVYEPVVERMKGFNGGVGVKARELGIWWRVPGFTDRVDSVQAVLESAIKTPNPETICFDSAALAPLVTSNHAILDVLPKFFYDGRKSVVAASVYTYVLHTYQAYSILGVRWGCESGRVVVRWEFVLRAAGGTSTSGSMSNLNGEGKGVRKGVMLAVESADDVEEMVKGVLKDEAESDRCVINIAVRDTTPPPDSKNVGDESTKQLFETIVKKLNPLLRTRSVRRITFMLIREKQFPLYFTFKSTLDFQEDQTIRHVEPALAYQLELSRLSHYDIKPVFTTNRRIHIYHAVGKKNPSDTRFFIRAIVYPGPSPSNVRTTDFLVSEGNRVLGEIMDALEVVAQGGEYKHTDCNHLFVNFAPVFEVGGLGVEGVECKVREFVGVWGRRLWGCRVDGGEVRFIVKRDMGQVGGMVTAVGGNGTTTTTTTMPIRFTIASKTGYTTTTHAYAEHRSPSSHLPILTSLTTPPGPLHATPVNAPYPTKESIQPKRYKAHLMGTTYIYDFPELFKRGVEKQWEEYEKEMGVRRPPVVARWVELGVGKEGRLEKVEREPGENTCGMVSWDFELFTPEYPQGRHIVVIANDITFNIGSFGPMEDLVFWRASEYARKLGIPRIYISANSGARIGLAEEVVNQFSVAWLDDSNPSKGFEYIYLTEPAYQKLVVDSPTPSVIVEALTTASGEKRYKITDVIGRQHGIGVENLQGSGMIAGETSLAYEEIFTLTLVTCRSVGIGAYLVRLGQRVIQVEYTPILLTGAAALNKVLGREVYTSNLQLGGTQIMYRNGVSHLVVKDDMEGVEGVIRWLGYVPKSRGGELPVLMGVDGVERDVEVPLESGDVRGLLGGVESEQGFMGGFFDRGTWTETLGGWAKGVVVGRARLGGIPVGVISVETKATETLIPADAADDKSTEQTITEAGGVWYPNSSHKTAQAIRDFDHGEELPLFVFANWRGFSGGQSDMYKEVLKFGAGIVDALRGYRRPVFVYVVGELRGGAWVVLDPTINPNMMEMFAESGARGGVLEPEGIVEIKFRRKQIVAAMERLDPTYKRLKEELTGLTKTAATTGPEAKKRERALQHELMKREKELYPVYHHLAIHFADLHDTPNRMLHKNVIDKIVPWGSSRRFFYWRLLRRIGEHSLINSILDADDSLGRGEAKKMVEGWFGEDKKLLRNLLDEEEVDEGGDGEVVRWLGVARGEVMERVERVRKGRMERVVEGVVRGDVEAGVRGLLKGLEGVDEKSKMRVLEMLRKGVEGL